MGKTNDAKYSQQKKNPTLRLVIVLSGRPQQLDSHVPHSRNRDRTNAFTGALCLREVHKQPLNTGTKGQAVPSGRHVYSMPVHTNTHTIKSTNYTDKGVLMRRPWFSGRLGEVRRWSFPNAGVIILGVSVSINALFVWIYWLSER